MRRNFQAGHVYNVFQKLFLNVRFEFGYNETNNEVEVHREKCLSIFSIVNSTYLSSAVSVDIFTWNIIPFRVWVFPVFRLLFVIFRISKLKFLNFELILSIKMLIYGNIIRAE